MITRSKKCQSLDQDREPLLTETKSKKESQVKVIERDDMGAFVKDIDVRRANMTYDEVTSYWNELRQELIKAGGQSRNREES